MTPFSLWVVGAMLVQGAIALVLLWVLGAIRIPLVARGKVRIHDVALSREPWPEHEKRVSNAFDNQFQLPVLLYVACGNSLFFGSIWIEAVFAWLFVLSRLIHAGVFATTNNVVHRFSAYTFGYGVLIAFWVELLLRLFFIWVWSRT
ncbi:MAG: MAPEG family protein [Devosia sp.]